MASSRSSSSRAATRTSPGSRRPSRPPRGPSTDPGWLLESRLPVGPSELLGALSDPRTEETEQAGREQAGQEQAGQEQAGQAEQAGQTGAEPGATAPEPGTPDRSMTENAQPPEEPWAALRAKDTWPFGPEESMWPLRPAPAAGTPPPRSTTTPVRRISAKKPRKHTSTGFRLTLCLLAVLTGTLAVAGYVATRPVHEQGEPDVAPALAATGRPPATDSTDLSPLITGSSGAFSYVGGYGPVLGDDGPIYPFRVAVEQPAVADAGAHFADVINRTLGDKRSWIAGHRFRFRRVPESAPARFTIYLASAGTSERMCRGGGLETDGYTSCRLPGRVIINDDRWETAIPGYGRPLPIYRAYAINHEVGHQLGHGHESCPGKGDPAPVMMQQTYGLKGCVANSWPYLSNRRYTGPPTS